MTVVIKNYEKFINIRGDIKKPWWFKFSNSFLEDPDFYQFTSDEIIAWVYILCQSSKRQCKKFDIDYDHATRSSNVKKEALNSCIAKLSKKGIILKSVRDPYAIREESVRDPGEIRATEENRIEKNRKENTYTHFEKCAIELYDLYPKKVGKKSGWVKMKTVLKSEKDFESLKTSIMNYTEHCRKNATEIKFIKQFDTFLSSWEDWLDPTTGTGKSFKKQSAYLSEKDIPDDLTRV